MAIPSQSAALPLMPTNCSVEMFAAMREKPMSHQVSPRPARKYSLVSPLMALPRPLLPFQMPKAITPTTAMTNNAMSSACIMG